MKRRYLAILIILMLIFSLMPVSAVAKENIPSGLKQKDAKLGIQGFWPWVSIETENKVVSKGDTFSLKIMLESTEDLYGASIDLIFDPNVLEVFDESPVNDEDGIFNGFDAHINRVYNNGNYTMIQYANSLIGDVSGYNIDRALLGEVTFRVKDDITVEPPLFMEFYVTDSQEYIEDGDNVVVKLSDSNGLPIKYDSTGCLIAINDAAAYGEITLNWSANIDLDAHLYVPDLTYSYTEIYYGNEGKFNEYPFAIYLGDDYGGQENSSETILYSQLLPGSIFAVNNWDDEFENIETITVTHGTDIFDIKDASGQGDWWYVFEVDEAGNIQPINEIKNDAPYEMNWVYINTIPYRINDTTDNIQFIIYKDDFPGITVDELTGVLLYENENYDILKFLDENQNEVHLTFTLDVNEYQEPIYRATLDRSLPANYYYIDFFAGETFVGRGDFIVKELLIHNWIISPSTLEPNKEFEIYVEVNKIDPAEEPISAYVYVYNEAFRGYHPYPWENPMVINFERDGNGFNGNVPGGLPAGEYLLDFYTSSGTYLGNIDLVINGEQGPKLIDIATYPEDLIENTDFNIEVEIMGLDPTEDTIIVDILVYDEEYQSYNPYISTPITRDPEYNAFIKELPGGLPAGEYKFEVKRVNDEYLGKEYFYVMKDQQNLELEYFAIHPSSPEAFQEFEVQAKVKGLETSETSIIAEVYVYDDDAMGYYPYPTETEPMQIVLTYDGYGFIGNVPNGLPAGEYLFKILKTTGDYIGKGEVKVSEGPQEPELVSLVLGLVDSNKILYKGLSYRLDDIFEYGGMMSDGTPATVVDLAEIKFEIVEGTDIAYIEDNVIFAEGVGEVGVIVKLNNIYSDIQYINFVENPNEVVLSVGSKTVAPGSRVTIPVTIQNVEDMAGGHFEIHYDPNVVRVVENGVVIDSFVQNLNPTINYLDDHIRIILAGTTGVSGDGTICTIEFEAIGSTNDETELIIIDVEFADSDLNKYTAATNNGFIKIGIKYGDVNGDLDIDFVDAIAVLQYDAGLRTFNDQQMIAGDVNDDSKVDFRDAIYILQYDAHLRDKFPIEEQ